MLQGRLSAMRTIASRATPTGGPTMVVLVLKLQCIYQVVFMCSMQHYQTVSVLHNATGGI